MEQSLYKCETVYYENLIPMEEYLRDCVDVPRFLSYCSKCSNFGKTWSCPEFSFDPMDFWKKFQSLRVIGLKIILPDELREKTFDPEGSSLFIQSFLDRYKKQFDEYILEEEKKTGGLGLNGGSCLRCRPLPCSRQEGKPCRQPDKMRYSIEALGGDASLTVTKYLHQKLEWMKDGKLPPYFILVGGILV